MRHWCTVVGKTFLICMLYFQQILDVLNTSFTGRKGDGGS